MQLFKTEMIFLHPPRPRPNYGVRSRHVLRYGSRTRALADSLALQRLHASAASVDSHRVAVSRPAPFDIEWAA